MNGSIKRKRLLEIEELEEVSIVDTPAVGDALVRLTKRDAAEAEQDGAADNANGSGPDWDLVTAYLDYQKARLDYETARAVDINAVWADIEAAAAEIRKRNPHLSGADALAQAVRLNPELERRYHLAQSVPLLEANLRRAEAWYRAHKRAAELQKREPGLTRLEALGRVFDADPALHAQTLS